MKKTKKLPMIVLMLGSLVALMALDVRAQGTSSTAKKETAATNFLQRGWYADQGVELPRPYGIGVNAIFMERDITVTDVSVKVGNLPLQSMRENYQTCVRALSNRDNIEFGETVVRRKEYGELNQSL